MMSYAIVNQSSVATVTSVIILTPVVGYGESSLTFGKRIDTAGPMIVASYYSPYSIRSI